MAEYHISYPILFPANASNLTTTIESIPVSLLYDRQGRVAKRYVGAVSKNFKRKFKKIQRVHDKKIANVLGGMSAWKLAGLPTTGK